MDTALYKMIFLLLFIIIIVIIIYSHMYTPYSKMAANKLFFCLRAN